MAAVVVDCLVMRSSHRGWLVGLAAGVKVVPGVFVLYFVLQRDWRSALRAVCGFLVTVVCGAIVAPQDSLRYWSGGLFGISHWGPVAVVDGKNQSLIGELARISHDPSPLLVTALVLSASGLALGIAAAHRQLLAPPMSPLAWVSWPCGHLASVAGAAANPLQRRTRRGA